MSFGDDSVVCVIISHNFWVSGNTRANFDIWITYLALSLLC